ncbi:hypothetical protein PY546_22765 [Providencia stuartii]|nr:hypothetical protein [Providencia stuartii]
MDREELQQIEHYLQQHPQDAAITQQIGLWRQQGQFIDELSQKSTSLRAKTTTTATRAVSIS